MGNLLADDTYTDSIDSGRVILCVPEGWNGSLVVDYFRNQVSYHKSTISC